MNISQMIYFVLGSGVNLGPLVTTVGLLGKFAITISFAIIILYTKEIFPTNLRYVCMYVCMYVLCMYVCMYTCMCVSFMYLYLLRSELAVAVFARYLPV